MWTHTSVVSTLCNQKWAHHLSLDEVSAIKHQCGNLVLSLIHSSLLSTRSRDVQKLDSLVGCLISQLFGYIYLNKSAPFSVKIALGETYIFNRSMMQDFFHVTCLNKLPCVLLFETGWSRSQTLCDYHKNVKCHHKCNLCISLSISCLSPTFYSHNKVHLTCCFPMIYFICWQ